MLCCGEGGGVGRPQTVPLSAHFSLPNPGAWTKLDLPGPSPPPRKGHAAASLGNWLVFFGGRTSDGGWLRGRTQTLLADTAAVVRSSDGVAWATVPVVGPPPRAREFSILAPLPGGRLMLTGGGDGAAVLGPEADTILDTRAAPFGGATGAQLARAPSAPRPPALTVAAGGDDAGPPSPLSLSSFDASPRVVTGGGGGRLHWWTGAPGAPALDALRSTLGLPPATGPGPSRFASADGGTPHGGRSITDIAAAPAAAMTLRDVATALSFLSASFRGGLHPTSPLNADRMTGRGRFLHADVGSLRVSDVEAVWREVVEVAKIG